MDRDTRNSILEDLGDIYMRLEKLAWKYKIAPQESDLRAIFGALTSVTHTVRFVNHRPVLNT